MQPNLLQLAVGTVLSVNTGGTVKVTFQYPSTGVVPSPSGGATGAAASLDCPAVATSAHSSVSSTGVFTPGHYLPGDLVNVLLNNSGSALCVLGVIQG